MNPADQKAVVSFGLMTAPWWFDLVHAVNEVAATVSVVCGAIVGLAAVYHLFRGK